MKKSEVYLRVYYYDRASSKQGRGVQAVRFDDTEKGLADARAFAERNRLYGAPCAVERVTVEVVP